MVPSGSPLRLVVCSTGVPHATTHPRLTASMMILYHYLAELKKRDVQILHVLVLDPATNATDVLQQYRDEMEQAGTYDILSIVRETLFQKRKHSFEPLRSVPPPPEALRAIEAFHPDVLFCFEMLAGAMFQDVTMAPKIIQVHDLKFLGLWFHTLYGLKENPLRILSLPLDWLRCRQWKLYYLSALKKFQRVNSVVASSADMLKKEGIPARYFPFPWPKLASAYGEKHPSLPAVPTFLFLGNLSGLGSRSALHFLFETIYPELLKQWGASGFKILICGANKVPAWITENIAKRPEMEFLGFVDDIDALMQRCHGVLAPMDVKTGNRSRIVTAMSLRVPVIAHTNTALGNPALIHGQTCFLSSDGKTFADHMRIAAERPPMVLDMIDRAEKVYTAQFEPAAATALLLEDLRAAL